MDRCIERLVALIVVIMASLVAGWQAVAGAQTMGTTSAVLPHMPQTYVQLDGGPINPTARWLTDQIARYVPAGSAKRALNLLGGAATCVQQRDMVAYRLYFQRSDPWAAGLVVVVSKANSRDPTIWLACGKQAVLGGGPGEPFSPCASTIEDSGFWYFYSGTKSSVCTDVRRTLIGGRREIGSPVLRTVDASTPVSVRAPAGAPAIVECWQFSQPGPYGTQLVNAITVYPPDIIGQDSRDLGGTYTPALQQLQTGGWRLINWPPAQQGQSMVFSGMPPGLYVVQLALQWPDKATGQTRQASIVVDQYAIRGGGCRGACAF